MQPGYANASHGAIAGAATYQNSTVPQSTSEIEREFNRLSNANERLGNLVASLWTSLNEVTMPAPPVDTTTKAQMLDHAVSSPLGHKLRGQALRVEEMEASLTSLLGNLGI